MRPLWIDGTIVPPENAKVSVLAHAMQRGSLVFDVGSFHETPSGTVTFRMREHVVRFQRSAGIVGLALAYDTDALEAATREAIRASGLTQGLIRWSAFFPNMEGEVVPLDPAARVAIAAYAPSDVPSRPKPKALAVAVFTDLRKVAPEAIPAEAKVAAAYLGPMLARRRALAEGFDEVVLLDRDGMIAEAPTSNVFAVVRGALVTPPLGKVLDGITRDSVIRIARDEGLEVREERLTLEQLSGAGEAFLTASSLPIVPIASINRTPIPVGRIAAHLKERLVAIQHGGEARYARWIARV